MVGAPLPQPPHIVWNPLVRGNVNTAEPKEDKKKKSYKMRLVYNFYIRLPNKRNDYVFCNVLKALNKDWGWKNSLQEYFRLYKSRNKNVSEKMYTTLLLRPGTIRILLDLPR